MRSHAKASSADSTRRARSAGRAVIALSVLIALCGLTVSLASGAAVVTEHLYNFGPDGTESSNFEHVNGGAVDQQTGDVYVLDSFAGALYKFEADGTPLDWGGSAAYISGNEITGLAPFTGANEAQVTVDSVSHVVYVTERHSVRAFREDGEAAEFTAGPGNGTSEIPGFNELVGVAVDSQGNIYASDFAGTAYVFSPAGEPLTSFAIPRPLSGNIGVGPDGTVYVVNNDPNGGVYRFVPSESPVTSTTTYTSEPKLDPSAGAFVDGVGVDPVNGDVYVLETTFANTWIAKYDSSGTFLRYIGKTGEGGESEGIGQGVAVVGGGEKFQVYLGANEGGGISKVSIFGELIVEGRPSIDSTSAINVASTSATLRAKINPDTSLTTYHFEYGLGDCSVTACANVPVGGAQIPSGHRPVFVTQDVTNLDPGTTYHYRVLAENSIGLTEGPDHTFTTQVTGLDFRLPDDRAWEMVSPPDKHGAFLFVSKESPIQASADGDGLTYGSFLSIESSPEGLRSGSTILARRGADSSWRSKDVTPPAEEVSPAAFGDGSEYKIFSPDLSKALVEPRNSTPLSPEASEKTPYWRQNIEPPLYRPLVTDKEGYANVPPGTGYGAPSPIAVLRIRTATPNLDHVVLKSGVPLGPGTPPGGLYEWTDGQIDHVSVLPDGEGGEMVAGEPGSEEHSVRHAISDDGARVFWTSETSPLHLYVRDTAAEVSARIDVPQAGGAGTVEPIFQGASTDGTVVFFTDPQNLTGDAGPAGSDLYRCELPLGSVASGCATLTDISVPSPGSGESAEVQGVASALADDGSSIYFVAKGVLDSSSNEFGDTATAGEPNLYIWEQGQGVSFIATLADEDSSDWGIGLHGAQLGESSVLTAADSPSGRYLAFMSRRSLTGYDNSDAASGQPAQEVFRYDALADRLICVSCNPFGASPVGHTPGQIVDAQKLWEGQLVAAALPEALALGNGGPTLYRPRSVFDSGRILFNAIDVLVPADSNGQSDVYEYEDTGVGDCTASSGGASTSRSVGGCVSLISSGTAEGETTLLDASATGDDAFFLTSAKLSVADEDEEPDVYDARVDGIPATLHPVSECLGESCQPAPEAPNDPTPASAAFHGQGNVKPHAHKRCAKAKPAIRRKGQSRCAPKKRRHHRSHHGKPGSGRRVGR